MLTLSLSYILTVKFCAFEFIDMSFLGRPHSLFRVQIMFHFYSRVEYGECYIPYRTTLRREEHTRSTAWRTVRLRHISIGETLRLNNASNIYNGSLLPTHTVYRALKKEIQKFLQRTILIDGFPGSMQNLLKFGRGSSIMRILSNL